MRRVVTFVNFRTRDSGAGVFVAAMILAGVQLALFWPGIMVWDAIRQYGQALTGRYDDWHPPAMNWLWRQLGLFGAGPAPMLVLQVVLGWAGLGLLATAVARRGGRLAAIATIACGLLPIPFWLGGTILKDSLMAAVLLLAAGLLAIRPSGDRVLRVVAMVLLLAAATLRFNAAAACLPLFIAALPPAWTRTRPRLALASLAASVPLLAAMPLANRLLDAERSGVELSLVIYDLAGITRFAGEDAFPPLPVAAPVAINARCYRPVSWDDYAWWGPAPCPIQFAMVRNAFAAGGIDPTRWWLAQIARHPAAYAIHRLAHVDRNLRLWTHDDDLPPLSLASDPNRWGYALPPSRARDGLARVARASVATPLGWPACWLALAVGLVILVPPGGDDMALPLAWSATLYALSYLPLSVASEVRYHDWTILAAALAAATVIGRGAAGIARRRLVAASVPVLATLAIAMLARLG